MKEPQISLSDYKLVILGDPKTQKRHRSVRRGAFNVQYDPSASDKDDIKRVVQLEAPETPLDGPLRVDILLFYGRPKNHYRTGSHAGELKPGAPMWHIKKPDRDNADKIVLDALNGIFWRDDSIVCDGRIVKMYSDKPRTEIYITRLGGAKTFERTQ